MIVAALDDLMFVSRVRTTASAVGVSVKVVRSVADGLEQARQLKPARLLVDLNGRAFDPLALIEAVKADPALAATRIVAFVSHVQADTIAAARGAGADEVIARSAFVKRLEELVRD